MSKTPLKDLKRARTDLASAVYYFREALGGCDDKTRSDALGIDPALRELQERLASVIDTETEFGVGK